MDEETFLQQIVFCLMFMVVVTVVMWKLYPLSPQQDYVEEIEKNIGSTSPLFTVSGEMLKGDVGTVYFDAPKSSPTTVLAPPPINFEEMTLKITNGKDGLKIEEIPMRKPSKLQLYLQESFIQSGWWTFLFEGFCFWAGFGFLFKGDTFGFLFALGSFLGVLGLAVYAFKQK